MNCAGREKRIALAVEGDLPAREAAELERHLGECAACRAFAGELRESQAALKELCAETVDAAVLDAIRGRVMAQVAAQRAPASAFGWRWMWAPACAAALALVMLWPAEAPELPPLPAPVAAIPAAPPPPVIRQPRAVLRAAAPERPQQPVPPLMMRIVTDDPGVVIYWIVESKETGE
jgi:anti-sigma factor RsiW